MKITEKNGIVKWKDDCDVPIGIGMTCGDDNGWKCQNCEELPEPKKEDWYKVHGKWFHVVKANDGGAYINGKLFPESTPYNERMKSLGWDFYEEILFVLETVESKYMLKAPAVWSGEEIPDIPMDLEITKLVPRERKLKERYVQHTDENGDTWIMPAKNVNLLPKESTMKTRYAVVNVKDKVEFEKRWEMPYGYNNCPHISFNQREAIQWINQNLGPNERKDYVVERHTAGKVEVVWKIVAGVTPKIEDFDDED